jgi:hypothetical protein
MTNIRRYSFRACCGAVTAQRAVPTNFGFRVCAGEAGQRYRRLAKLGALKTAGQAMGLM